jgi:hypothetical protein
MKWFRFIFLNPLSGLLLLAVAVYLAVWQKDWATAALIVAGFVSFAVGCQLEDPWKKSGARP